MTVNPDAPLIRCQRLVVGHEGRALLPPFDFDLRPGRVVSIIGRNGAGKTTVLRTLLGLLPPIDGVIERAANLRMAYVPQVAAIDPVLPWRARDVVAYGRLRGWNFMRPIMSAADKIACREAIGQGQLADLGRRPFGTLSRGQQQRVMFARLLAAQADVAALDEPTAAMDAVAGKAAFEQIAQLPRIRQCAVILVTHDLDTAARYSDLVMLVDRDDEEIVIAPPAEVIAHPAFGRRYRGHTPPPTHAR